MNDKEKEFIKTHIAANVSDLILKYSRCELGFDLKHAVMQIDARQRTRSKIPSFIKHADFCFPALISAEQCTNESVAQLHASLIGKDITVADMTAGLGIDAMTIAAGASEVTAFEMDEVKAETLRHNMAVMRIENMNVIHADSMEWLREHPDFMVDVMFIDPARRLASGSRAFSFKDCQPDVVSHMELLLSHCNRLFIKASPMLDLSQILYELPSTRSLYVVSVKGECKEILIEVSKGDGLEEIHAIEIMNGADFKIIDFELREEAILESEDFLSPGGYIYQPSAGVMKMGRFANLTRRYEGLMKLDDNTQVYYSSKLINDFPGRILQLQSMPHERSLKGRKMNVVARNYPLTADQLKKRLRIKDGDDDYLYAVKVAGKPILLLCRKIEGTLH